MKEMCEASCQPSVLLFPSIELGCSGARLFGGVLSLYVLLFLGIFNAGL